MGQTRVVFSALLSSFSLSVPQPHMEIRRSQSGLVFVGNNFTLNAEVSFNGSAIVNVSISLTISWSRDGDIIISNDHITISNVSDSESGYTASLTYSPITTSDSGLITANITVSPSDNSMYIQSVTSTATDALCIQGKNPIYNNIYFEGPILDQNIHIEFCKIYIQPDISSIYDDPLNSIVLCEYSSNNKCMPGTSCKKYKLYGWN